MHGVGILVLACVGCATASYRIPGEEMERLATTDVAVRGHLLRVVPTDESTRALAAIPEPISPAPPAVAYGPPGLTLPPPAGPPPEPMVAPPYPTIVEEVSPAEPELVVQPNIIVEEHVAVGPVGPTSPPPFRPWARESPREAPVVRGSPSRPPELGHPVFVPAVGPMRAGGFPIGSGAPRVAAGASMAPPVRGTAGVGSRSMMAGSAVVPTTHAAGGGGGGRGGGGHASSGAGGAIAAIAAVVIVVGLIAAVAAASEPPPPFDGWVETNGEHPLHLSYGRGVERVVRLKDIRPVDLVGLRDTILKDSEGTVLRARPAPLPATLAARR